MVVGRILGMAGKALAKKFMKGVSKSPKKGGPNAVKSISSFVKRHPKVTAGAVGSGVYLHKKKD